MYFVQHLRHVLKLLPLQGATTPTRDTQGAASLALGYEEHWAFSPLLLNPKVEILSLLVKWTMHKKSHFFVHIKTTMHKKTRFLVHSLEECL